MSCPKVFQENNELCLFSSYRRLIANPKQTGANIPSWSYLGNIIKVKPYVGDVRFDRCIRLVDKSVDALDWPRLTQEWRRSGLFLPVLDDVASIRRYPREHELQRIYPCETAAPTPATVKHEKQIATPSSSCETSPADMAPFLRLTQTQFACSSLHFVSPRPS